MHCELALPALRLSMRAAPILLPARNSCCLGLLDGIGMCWCRRALRLSMRVAPILVPAKSSCCLGLLDGIGMCWCRRALRLSMRAAPILVPAKSSCCLGLLDGIGMCWCRRALRLSMRAAPILVPAKSSCCLGLLDGIGMCWCRRALRLSMRAAPILVPERIRGVWVFGTELGCVGADAHCGFQCGQRQFWFRKEFVVFGFLGRNWDVLAQVRLDWVAACRKKCMPPKSFCSLSDLAPAPV